jgi:hypothetical protein
MPIIPTVPPSVRACFALAGLALGCAACAPTPYDQIAYAPPDCRPFQQQVTVNGKQQTRYTTQCLQPDGTWRLVAQSDGSSQAASAQPQAGEGAVVPITPDPSGVYGTEPADPSFAIGAADDPNYYSYGIGLNPYDGPYEGYIGPDIALGVGYGGPGWHGYHPGFHPGGFHPGGFHPGGFHPGGFHPAGGFHGIGGFHGAGGFHGGGGGGGHR